MGQITKGHNSVKNVIQVVVLILYTSSDYPLYFIKFLSGHKKCTKGNKSIIKGRVMVLFSAHPLTILYIFMKFSENPF